MRYLHRYLVKRDLFQVPVLDVKEKDDSARLVPAGQNHGVPCLDGAADRLRGQVLEQLRIILPEAHVTWRTPKHIDTQQMKGQIRSLVWHLMCQTITPLFQSIYRAALSLFNPGTN